MSLDFNKLHDLNPHNKTHIYTVAQLKVKFSKVTTKSRIPLSRLAALVNLPDTEDLVIREFHKLLAYKQLTPAPLPCFRK